MDEGRAVDAPVGLSAGKWMLLPACFQVSDVGYHYCPIVLLYRATELAGCRCLDHQLGH